MTDTADTRRAPGGAAERSARRREVWHGVVFALGAGCLGALRGLNTAGEDARLLLQDNPIRADLPLPVRLVRGFHCVEEVANWGLISAVAVGILSGALGLVVLHRLNPRFLAVRPGGRWLQREVDLRSAVAALPVLLLAALAYWGVWRWLGPLVGNAHAVAGMAAGAVLFALLSEGGVWGALSGPWPGRPSDGWGALGAGLLGALAGVVAAGATARDPLLVERDLLTFARGLADYDCDIWSLAPWVFGAVQGAVSFCAAGVVWALARPQTGWGTRLTQAGPALLVGLAFGVAVHYGYQHIAVQHRDFGTTLTQATGARVAWLEPRTALTVLGRDRPVAVGVLPRQTSVSLADDPENSRLIMALLKRRDNRTTLARDAMTYLVDCAALQWDPEELVRWAERSAEHAPFQFVQAAFIESLGAARITPTTTQAVLLLADERQFVCLAPKAHRRVADLLRRYGFAEAAAREYRAAGDSAEKVERVRSEPRLVTGTVRGRVLVDEQPAAGFRAGLIAASEAYRLGGPVTPEEQLAVCGATLTDDQGRFELGGLPPGEYALTVATEGSQLTGGRPLVGLDASFTAIVVTRKQPNVDLGYLRIIAEDHGGERLESQGKQAGGRQ